MRLAGFQQGFQGARVHLELAASAAFLRHQSSHQRQSRRRLNPGLGARLDPGQFTPFPPPGAAAGRRRGLPFTPAAILAGASGREIASRDHVAALGNRLGRVPQRRERLGIQVADWPGEEAEARVAIFDEEESRPRIGAEVKGAFGESVAVGIQTLLAFLQKRRAEAVALEKRLHPAHPDHTEALPEARQHLPQDGVEIFHLAAVRDRLIGLQGWNSGGVLRRKLHGLERDIDHAVLLHQLQVPRDFAEIGPHDDEEGIEVRHLAPQFCFPALDAIDVGEHVIQVGAPAEAVEGGLRGAIDGHGDIGEWYAHEPFGPFVIDQRAVGADAQDGAPDESGHVVDQLAESADGEDFTALDAKRGDVGIERHELSPQLVSDLGGAEQGVSVLRLVAMEAIDVAAVSKHQAEAAGPGAEIHVPLLVFQTAETEIVVVGSLRLGGYWLGSHKTKNRLSAEDFPEDRGQVE